MIAVGDCDEAGARRQVVHLDADVIQRNHAVAQRDVDGSLQPDAVRDRCPDLVSIRVLSTMTEGCWLRCRWRRCRSGIRAGNCRRRRRAVLCVLKLMQALVSWLKLPIDDFSMCTAPAFWMSMPMSGSGATRRHARDVESAQRDVIAGAGIDHDSGRGARPALHADAAVDSGGADDLDRLVDRHRTVAGGVENDDLAAGETCCRSPR